MADKNQQWDELDYSDENQEGYEDSGEYEEEQESSEFDGSEEDYEDDGSEEYEEGSEEYEDDGEYEEEDEEPSKKKKGGGISKAVIAVLLLLLLGGGGYFVAQSMSANKGNVNSSDIAAVQTAQGGEQNSGTGSGEDFFADTNDGNQDMMNVSFNENGETNINDNQDANGDVITVSDPGTAENNDLFINNALEEQNQSNDSIMVSYNKAARLNPFKPPIIAGEYKHEIPYAVVDDTEFEIIEPPAASRPDENLTKLLQTQISGIMYDPTSPSAIINLNGTDYFVKIGDKVSGYLIKNITRDKVQVNYKNNTYVASVGQLFTKGTIEHENVPDFEHKFAGRYKNSK